MVCSISHVADCWPASLFPISRLNTKLEANGYPPMRSLVQDLSDGVRLIQLMVRRTLCTVVCNLIVHSRRIGNHG